jgi:hypothetical protein
LPIDDQTKTAFVANVAALVRSSPVKVDVQRLSMAFHMSIDGLEPGQPVELQPLFEHMMTSLAVAEKEALQLCVIIGSRQDKLGLPITLPLKAQTLSAEAVERIIAVHNEKRTVTGTWEVRKPEPEKPPVKKGEPGWEPSKEKQGPSRRPLVLGSVLAVGVVAAVGFNLWLASTKVPIIKVPPPVGGVPCVDIITNKTTAICTIPLAVWSSTPKETMAAKILVTKSGLRSSGVTSLLLRTAEDTKIVLIK